MSGMVGDRIAVDLADLDGSQLTGVDEASEGRHPCGVGGGAIEQVEAAPAPLEMYERLAGSEHHERAGGSVRTATALGPRQRSAIWLSGVASCERDRRRGIFVDTGSAFVSGDGRRRPAVRTGRHRDRQTKYPRRTWPRSSISFRIGYTPANPPSAPSASAISLVSTP